MLIQAGFANIAAASLFVELSDLSCRCRSSPFLFTTMSFRLFFSKDPSDSEAMIGQSIAIVIEVMKETTVELEGGQEPADGNNGSIGSVVSKERIANMDSCHIIMPSTKQVYAARKLNTVSFLFCIVRILSTKTFATLPSKNRFLILLIVIHTGKGYQYCKLLYYCSRCLLSRGFRRHLTVR